jgi:hypothetical protein
LLFNWEADGASPSGVAYSTATCTTTAPPSDLDVGTQWSAEHPNYKVVYGHVFVDAATVEVDLVDGSTSTLPVVEHDFLGVIDGSERVATLRALDGNANEVAHEDIGPPPH